MQRALAVLVVLLAAAGARAEDDLGRGANWVKLSAPEKLLMAKGLIGGSQGAVEILLPRARWALMGMKAQRAYFEGKAREMTDETIFSIGEEQLKSGRYRSFLRFKPEQLVEYLDKFYSEPRNLIIRIPDAAYCINQGSVTSKSVWAAYREQSYRGYEGFMKLTREGTRDTAPLLHNAKLNIAPGPFGAFKRPDGKTKSYYCLNKYLGAALANGYEKFAKDSWWYINRDHDYHFKPFRYMPAERKRRAWALDYLKRRSPATGLVPVGRHLVREDVGDEFNLHAWSCGLNIAREYLEWFGDDPEIVSGFEEYVRTVVKRHFDQEKKWLYRYVDARDGKQIGTDYVDIHEFTPTVTLGKLYSLTKKDEYRQWALAINRLPWDQRPFKNVSVTVRGILAPGAKPRLDWDTDCIYWLRSLTRLYEWTGEPLLKEMIVGCARDYVKAAWSEEHGHFLSRHLLADGTRCDDRLYGDAFFNSFYLMSHAARLSGDKSFMAIWDKQWATFNKLLSVSGLLSDLALESGAPRPGYGFEMDDNGVYKRQDIWAGIILDAYETTKDTKYLDLALDWADRALKAGPDYWDREDFSDRFAEVAAATGTVCRVEVDLGAPGAQLKIAGPSGEMAVTVLTEIAVVYLDRGKYRIEAATGGKTAKTEREIRSDEKLTPFN